MRTQPAAAAILLLALSACSGNAPPPVAPAAVPTAAAGAASVPASAPAAVTPVAAPADGQVAFTPPAESAIPTGPLGDVIRQGRAIFTHTSEHAKAYVGNALNCSNCHLDAGRLANSAPLWGAYVVYPQYRSKNGQVNNYGERMQGCFKFSMNGKPPPLDSKEMLALEAYSHWLSTGAPVGAKLVGAGYPKQCFSSPLPPDYARGKLVYDHDCALCHGADGAGQQVAGKDVFPPLWGAQSYNWGAGMTQLDNAAAFIKANMPLGRGGSLSDQDAWDVAMYINAHERPQDPRYTGNLAQTRKQFHDSALSLYGTTVDGRLLGSQPATPKPSGK
jgi:thiosulfate dehydrogenase